MLRLLVKVYSPTDALVSCLKNIIKIYIKTAVSNVNFNNVLQDNSLVHQLVNK